MRIYCRKEDCESCWDCESLTKSDRCEECCHNYESEFKPKED